MHKTVTPEALLAVDGLCVRYPMPGGWAVPLRDVGFRIAPGEMVGLIGDAGSGKSTLALALLGIVRPPGEIVSGNVTFAGQDLLGLDEDALRALRGRDIGVIVQNPRAALNPMLRVGRQIGNVYRAHNPAGRTEVRQKAVDMLAQVGINDPERRVASYAHELSGGMAQRALIAMALSSAPRLLIADEPTSGLDVTIQAQFLDQMWRNVQETGSAVLLISQDLGVIANYCDRVLVLHEGRIVEDRPARTFFAAPEHPYAQEVLALQREDMANAEADTEGTPLIEIEGLVKHFPLRGTAKVVQAVGGADLTIRRGETLGLVGESGSGKTTVGRCLMRLETLTDGAIRYDGQEIGTMPMAAFRGLRARMQIVLQDPYDSLDPRWTVERILREPLDVHTRLSAAEKRDRIGVLMDMVGLDRALRNRRPRGLGSGALQRINIARALATEPEFVVLDEPTSVLAPAAVTGLIQLLRRLQAELGLSFLFISHDLTTVGHLCHRVAVMYLGQIVELGTVDQVFRAPAHPYAQSLLASHLFPDPENRRVDQPDTRALSGEIPSPVDLPEGCYLATRCPFVMNDCRTTKQTLSPLPDGRQVRCMRVARGEI
ncbi:MAG: ABC transporter ATP-binding protein [Pseudomonadota bacterium]